MRRYIIQRLLTMLPTLLGVSLLVFVAVRLIPGDEIKASLGTEAGLLTDNQRAALERYYGLDKPLHIQYVTWLSNALRGNLGTSVRHGEPVLNLILDRFPVTLELAILSLCIALTLGIFLGTLSAIFHNTLIDLFGQIVALIGLAVPNFLVATLIIYVLSVYFSTLPNTGKYVELTEDPIGNLKQLVFPALTLGMSFAASVMRTTRSAMLEVLGEDYIRTARSKGLKGRTVIRRHALRNALIPVVTLSGVEFGYLLGGAIIVEEIFALPGIGRLTLLAVKQRNYALVQGAALFIAVNFVIINLLVDIIYAKLDPRISYGD